MISFRRWLCACVFMLSVSLLIVRLLGTKSYNDILRDDFVPNEKYTDYLDNDCIEDVDIKALREHFDAVIGSITFISETIVLDRDIHYYAEPDVNSDIIYTLNAGEVYYLYGSVETSHPRVYSFATYTRGWRYALPLLNEKQYQEINKYGKQPTYEERQIISKIPYTDQNQRYAYIQLEDLIYITRKCEFTSGYFSFWEKVHMMLDDRYAQAYLYGHDEYYWREGVYISPDLYLEYWRLTEKILMAIMIISGAGFLYKKKSFRS